MRVYIGYDGREEEAFNVAKDSLKRCSYNADCIKLDAKQLASNGLLHRLVDRRGAIYDLASNAPCATDFAISRFLVPIIAHTGWVLFTDCDVLFMDDVDRLMKFADPEKAVMVVKHNLQVDAMEATKMDGQMQTFYNRKNWSSVMLFNCDHPANRRLTVADVNNRPGIDLHQFYWLHDSEIGELAPEWNWLVNVQPKPDKVSIAHFTLGGPWIPGWSKSAYDNLWSEARRGRQ